MIYNNYIEELQITVTQKRKSNIMSAKIQVVETAKNPSVSTIVGDTSLNTSQKIRSLDSLGIPRAEIALLLDKRYQHVRNVLLTPLTGKQKEEPSKIVEMMSL